jgi:hypothetical protein
VERSSRVMRVVVVNLETPEIRLRAAGAEYETGHIVVLVRVGAIIPPAWGQISVRAGFELAPPHSETGAGGDAEAR